MTEAEKVVSWSGRKRIKAAFTHSSVDRVPRFDQTVSSRVATAVMGREMLVGSGSLRFREVEERFLSDEAGAEFEEKMLKDVVDFYRVMGYDMVRMPWRDRRKATRKIDQCTYLFGDDSGNEPWEICRFNPDSDDWHSMDTWLAGGNVEKLCAYLEKERQNWQGPQKSTTLLEELKKLRSLAGYDIAVATSVAMLMIPMWEPAWLMALELAPDLVEDEFERQTEQGIADLYLVAESGVDVNHSGGDFCLNTGPVYSPATFDRIVLPRLKRIVEASNKVGIPYVYRTDGNTWPVAESLLGKSGIHGYGEIDYGAGMRLRELRARFPRLTLVGNIDCGAVLILGTPEEVRRKTRENLEDTGGIGHIFGASNAVMAQTPPENYLAMLDEADRFRP